MLSEEKFKTEMMTLNLFPGARERNDERKKIVKSKKKKKNKKKQEKKTDYCVLIRV